MSERKYQMEFEAFCLNSGLGELVQKPVPVSGGLLHRMYALETSLGKYAVKLLNPNIMARPTAMLNYINSEKIARLVSQNIPALPAKSKNGDSIQNEGSQFYLVFDWIEGKSLGNNEINAGHCEKIGGILSAIHQTDFSRVGIGKESIDTEQPIVWSSYLEKGRLQGVEWYEVLLDNLADLKEWEALALKANTDLSANSVLSHRDLDPKNVIWNHDQPILIDWESAGFIHPMQDLVETAIYWSVNEKGELNHQRFLSFLEGYKKTCAELHADWKRVLATGFSSKLAWLEYSLKRSLWIECADEEEQKLGTDQVTATIHEIRHYAEQFPQLLLWLTGE